MLRQASRPALQRFAYDHDDRSRTRGRKKRPAEPDRRKAEHRTPFAGFNRIRFQGSILNPCLGIPLAVGTILA
jgi:hypothetical protein